MQMPSAASPPPPPPIPNTVPTAVAAAVDLPYFSGTRGSEHRDAEMIAMPSLESCLEAVYDHLMHSAAPVPNPSTVPIPHANADSLYQLDQVSQDIVTLLVAHQKTSSALDGVSTPLLLEQYEGRRLELPRFVASGELQRHRRQFVKMNSQHPQTGGPVAVGTAFIDFLLNQLY